MLILITGGTIGFYISQRLFPKFDYGYTKEGVNKIVTRIKKPSLPETNKLTKILKVPEGMTIED